MCGVVGQLLYILCRSGCQPSSVASALAFHPPESNYSITFDEDKQEYSLQLASDLPISNYKNMTVVVIQTKSHSLIPIFHIKVPNPKYTMIYSHGNATDCGAMLSTYIHIALALNINVVAYEYTGYGTSVGIPSEKQTYLDIEAVYEWCCEQGGVSNPSESLLIYGQSVGSGPSCYIASTKDVAGLILHSPFTSGIRVLTPSRVLACFDIFPNIDRIADIKCPLFIIHGMEDMEVPQRHGLELFNAAPVECRTQSWWVPNRGHNNVLERNELEYFRRLSTFFDSVNDFYRRNQETSGKSSSSKSSVFRMFFDRSYTRQASVTVPVVEEKRN